MCFSGASGIDGILMREVTREVDHKVAYKTAKQLLRFPVAYRFPTHSGVLYDFWLILTYFSSLEVND